MRGVGGCFVCGQYHRTIERKSRDEVHSDVQKLMGKLPKALITIEEPAFIESQLSEEETENDE